MSRYKIVFADDEPDTQELVRILLSSCSVDVIPVIDGKDALKFARDPDVDLVLLDVMMPDLDGLETLRLIRQVSDVPVILVTVKDQEDDIILGFNEGAYDYIIKPFSTGEFVARVQSVLKRTSRRDAEEAPPMELVFNRLSLNLAARQVLCDGQLIDVSHLEFSVLHFFLLHPCQVISKQELLRAVWGFEGEAHDLNMVEAVIARLRKKLKQQPDCDSYIQTIRSAGYRLSQVD